jgi:hypothetical protein
MKRREKDKKKREWRRRKKKREERKELSEGDPDILYNKYDEKGNERKYMYLLDKIFTVILPSDVMRYVNYFLICYE